DRLAQSLKTLDAHQVAISLHRQGQGQARHHQADRRLRLHRPRHGQSSSSPAPPMNYGVKLTPELEAQIIAMIRQGAFPQDAFRAAGVPDQIREKWLDPNLKRGRYAKLRQKVAQAVATARAFAAIEIRKTEPFKWAANGPARDAPGEPGW